MMRLRIQHRCDWRYPGPVKYSALALRLTPRHEPAQLTLNWSIHAPGRRAEQLDAHGNVTHLLTLEEPHRDVEIVVAGLVEMVEDGGLLPHDGPLSPLAYLGATPPTRASEPLSELGARHVRAGATRDSVLRLARAVGDRLDGAVPEDVAHAVIGACRTAGVPARFVSGYLHAEEDSARHAWIDAWNASESGWMPLDVVHLIPAGSHHCRLAVGRDCLDAAPLRAARPGELVETLRIREQ